MPGSDHLERGHEAFRRRAWADAYAALRLADKVAPLGGADLEMLATAAYLTGRDSHFYSCLDRAYRERIGSGDRLPAARCAFWSCLGLLLRGEQGRASGWLARARRLVEGSDCAEAGYLLLPEGEQHLQGGDALSAQALASRAATIGERFADPELIACARHLEGRALIRLRRLQAGLVLLDEAMLGVVAGDLSPIMTGLLYCSVIGTCQEIYALSRAREWSAAMARWCERQSQMISFKGVCAVHLAQIMQLNGEWSDAEAQLRRLRERPPAGANEEAPAGTVPAEAAYQQGELNRLKGEFEAAERAYHEAARMGRDPHPGLALLRLAQGRTEAACAAVLRVLEAATGPLDRARLLPAVVEIFLEAGELDQSRRASQEMDSIARDFEADVLHAMAAHARGAVHLAAGEPGAALTAFRQALTIWTRVEAVYEIARLRMLIGRACLSLGDEEAGRLEMGEARSVFERLGAAPDLARLDGLERGAQASKGGGLSRRELQVLRLIARGKTNRAIAAELLLSERTIDRHVHNILTKLGVPTRSAAVSSAHDHGLL